MSASPSKKTIYVDVDEEITGIIDKVRSTDESILALVLPKRATMLQSVVNMKLLKRAADQAKKRVVLITSEAALMPLAGSAGLHVAANLQSRPHLPPAPAAAASKPAKPEIIDADEPIDPNTPIGDLADTKSKQEVAPIEIDNVPKAVTPAAAATAAKKASKPKKEKNKQIPNFQRFRLLLIGGAALLLLLILGGYYALAVAPKATITLRTESSEVPTNASFSADTGAETLNVDAKVLPAKNQELKKSVNEKVAASGQRDDGTKASGSVTLRNCTDNSVTIPAGTGISNGSLTFITQSSISLKEGEFTSKNSGSQCKTSGDHTGTVSVVAQNNGDQYNLSPRSYTVSGFGGVVAQGDQMNGGSSKITKVVAQADIDAVKKKVAEQQNSIVEEMRNQMKGEGYIGLVDSFSGGNPTYNASPAVGSEANEVVVTADITYTMIGIKEADLKKIIEDQSKDKVDVSKQSILNYGIDEASFEVGKKKGTVTPVNIKTTLVAGPEINQDELKKELAGKKRGDAEALLKSRPGITDVRIELKPFFVSKVPGKAAKITFVVEQANGKPVTP